MITLPLDQMSRIEKLQAMEVLWENLSRDESAFESPAWHAEVLKQAEAQVKSGEARFVDWEAAKKDLRRRLE